MTEKITFKNSKGLNLVGILDPVRTDKIVLICHGFTSYKDSPKLIKLADALGKADFATLRFDFGGHGESDSRSIGAVSEQVDDLKSAIAFVKKKGYTKISLMGSSLGGLTCILAVDETTPAVVLFAPVTAAKTPKDYRDPQIRKELEEKGHHIISRHGKEFKIEKQYVTEREQLNQKEMLSKIKCPVLIIQGDKDDDVHVDNSKNAMQFLSKESKLEIIEGASHGLYEQLDRVISLSVNWFKEHS